MRRTRLLISVIAVSLLVIPATPSSASDGCDAIESDYLPVDGTYESMLFTLTFDAGETLSVTGAGEDFEVAVDTTGSGPIPSGATFDYTFESSNSYTVSWGPADGSGALDWTLTCSFTGVPDPDPAPDDTDGDGLPDDVDLCPGTVEDAPTSGRLPNRYWDDTDGAFVDGDGVPSGYTLVDTGGCSASQIVEATGLGQGHLSFGLTAGALENWVASTNGGTILPTRRSGPR